MAEEVTAFKLTGVEGNIGLLYQSDEQITSQSATPNVLTVNEQQVSFLTHSYVYHPKLLNIDFGMGVLHTQNEVESSSGSSEYDDDLYSLTAQLRFLEGKPYPVTLFYNRSTPSVSPSHSERYIQKNIKYGVNAAINEPVLPFSINVEAFKQTQQGYGSTQILNSSTEQIKWRAYKSFGDTGYGQLTYYTNMYESENGVIGQTIEKRQTKTESTSLDTNFNFGQKKQLSLHNLISWYTQDALPAREELRITPNLTWRHSDQTFSYYRFDYADSKIEQTETISKNGAIGLRSELTETVTVNGSVHEEAVDTTGLSNQTTGVRTNISYSKPLSFGRLALSAGGGYNKTRRDSSVGSIDHKGESVRLDGLQKVALTFPNVLAVTKVIHANPDRQYITLIEGVDYEIEIPIDNVGYAYIRRLGTINLQSGESVLVDYQYQTGGSVVYTSFNQHYHAQLDLFKYYSVYLSYSDTSSEIQEGSPTIPVSSVSYTRAGARVDHPFYQGDLMIGAEASREEKDDEISPYIRKQYETYVQKRFFSDTHLRLSSRWVKQDNQNTPEDVDLQRQSVRLTTHPFPRSTLSFEISDEKDTGSSTHRRIKQESISGKWRIRKLTLVIDARSIHETHGSYKREHNIFMARLRREF